jgi:hypothetical protein
VEEVVYEGAVERELSGVAVAAAGGVEGVVGEREREVWRGGAVDDEEGFGVGDVVGI